MIYRKVLMGFCVSQLLLFTACSDMTTKEKPIEQEQIEKKEESVTVAEQKAALPDNFFLDNRMKLAEKIGNGSVLILYGKRNAEMGTVVKNPDDQTNLGADRNFYYLTGIKDPEGIVVIRKEEDEIKETLYTSKDLKQSKEISKIQTIKEIQTFKKDQGNLLTESNVLYVDLGPLERTEIQIISELQNEANKKGIAIQNIYPVLTTFRMVKSVDEINMIRDAISVTNAGIKAMMKASITNKDEKDLEQVFRKELKERNIKRMSFDPIIGGGKNSTDIHYLHNNQPIKPDDIVVTDVGAEYDYYAADITRTFPSDGTFTDRQRQIYEIVLKAQEETIKAVRPGITLMDLEKTAKSALTEGLIQANIISDEYQLRDYYPHMVSHHIGLDVHDVTDFELPLQPGNVISIEPGIYLINEQLGVRIEDNLLITEGGNEILSKDLIKTVEEIESFMKP